MVQEPERRVDHVTGAGGDLRAATKTGQIVADVAVVLLDREGQILAGEELLRRNQPVKAFPVVGQEDTALDADLVEKSAAGRIITPTQLPGQGSPCHRVVGPPPHHPSFLELRSRACDEAHEDGSEGGGAAWLAGSRRWQGRSARRCGRASRARTRSSGRGWRC